MLARKNKKYATYHVSLVKSRIYRAMNSYMSRALEPYDLSPPEWTLLGIIYENQTLQPTEMALYLGVKPPVVTTMLRSMEAKKLIRKSAGSEDGRVKTVSLTPKGHRVIDEAEVKMQQDLKDFTRGIKHTDIKRYLDVLDQISQKLTGGTNK